MIQFKTNNSELIYNKKYLKAGKNPLQKIDSVYRKDENCYPKVFLEKFIHNFFLEKFKKFWFLGLWKFLVKYKTTFFRKNIRSIKFYFRNYINPGARKFYFQKYKKNMKLKSSISQNIRNFLILDFKVLFPET